MALTVVHSKAGLVAEMNEAATTLRAQASEIESIYRRAAQREKDGFAPAAISNEAQTLLAEIEDAVQALATDLNALQWQFQTRHVAGTPAGADTLQVMPAAYYDVDGDYAGCGAVQPSSVETTWYDGATEPFAALDRLELDGAGSNDGTYTVDQVADQAADGLQYVKNGTFPDSTYGATVVTNGDFASGVLSPWTGTNWAVVSNKARHTAGSTAALTYAGVVASSTRYRITFTVSNRTAGSVTPALGSESGSAVSSNSTDVQYIVCTGGTDVTLTPTTDFDGDIDDIEVIEWPWGDALTGASASGLGTGWSITGNKAVKTAGTASDICQSVGNMFSTPGTPRIHHVRFTVSDYSAGTLTVKNNSDSDAWLEVTANGTYDLVAINSSGAGITFSGDATFAGKVSAVTMHRFRGVVFTQALGGSVNDSADATLSLVARDV